MFPKSHLTLLVAATVAGLGVATNAYSVVINFDLAGGPAGSGSVSTVNDYAGQGAAGVGGTTWNTTVLAGQPSPYSILSATYTGVKDSTGNSSAVNLNFTYTGAFNSGTNTNATDPNTLLQQVAYARFGTGTDGLFTSTNLPSFTLTGLTSGGSYDLYFYLTNGNYHNSQYGTTVTIGSTSLTASSNSQDNSFASGNTYVEFTNVVASNSGTIAATYASVPYGNEADFNGLQVVNVSTPEPATLGLFAVGAIGLLLLKRRKLA